MRTMRLSALTKSTKAIHSEFADGSAGGSHTFSVFHAAMENSRSFEDKSLKILRRLLIAVLIVVVGVSAASISIAKTVISDGVTSANQLSTSGTRTIAQQVTHNSLCRF